jgi:hypothetical protein
MNRTTVISAVLTDAEKLSDGMGSIAGKSISCGSTGSGDAATSYLYRADFFAAAAELSFASLKVLLQTLGWTIAWT